MSGWETTNAGGGDTAADSWGGAAANTADSGWDNAPAANGNDGGWNEGGAAASGGDSFGVENLTVGDNGGADSGGDRACYNCGQPG